MNFLTVGGRGDSHFKGKWRNTDVEAPHSPILAEGHPRRVRDVDTGQRDCVNTLSQRATQSS